MLQRKRGALRVGRVFSGERNPMYGKKHSAEARKKISEALKGENHPMYGKKHSAETRKKIGETKKGKCVGENNSMYGKEHSVETRRKISEAHKRRRVCKTCQKCSNDFYGRKGQKFCSINCSAEFHTGKNNPMYGRGNRGYTGRTHTEEFKKAMVGNKRGLGYRHTEEIRAKIFGKNHPMYGKSHTEEAKRKISLANIGPKNSSWKGGISFEPYCSAWVDEEYKEDIKARDNYRCQGIDCRGNSSHLPLEIHHIDYDKKNCHPSNLTTLCKSCNARANFDRQWWQSMYTQLMKGEA